MQITRRYNLIVMEDVAQALGGSFPGRNFSFGHAAALSFFRPRTLVDSEMPDRDNGR